MPVKTIYQTLMPIYVYILLLTLISSCGLLGSDEDGGLLNVKTISAVEVALEVSGIPGDQIAISRDGEERYSFRISQVDTVIYESGLEPATSYTWRITSQNTINGRAQTTERKATTLDTTSSNFTWQTFSFGEHSSSVLYGVSIIDENNIWAVGEIHMNDSTGQPDSRIYNAVHWDGSTWNLKRITADFRGNHITIPLEGVQAISPTDIWMAGSLPVHGDGENWNIFDVRSTVDKSLSLWEIWGIKPNDVYAAGRNGSMAHWDGENWQKIETNTELDFYDIHGKPEQGVVAVAAKRSESRNKIILRIKDNLKTETLSTAPIPFSISGIWFDETGVSYLVGSGLFLKSKLESPAPWKPIHQYITPYYLDAIDANGLNDIVTVGAFGEFLHFNGTKWTSFQSRFDGNLLADVAIQGNITVAVGFEGRQAFITIGKRE